MAYANPGVFLQALQGAAQQHRMVLTKSLTTFATHQRSKTRYDISIQIYTKQSVYMCIYIYIHCNIYIYICIVYVDNEKLINIYKTLQVCKHVYIYVCTYIYVCIYIYVHVCDFFMRDHFISMYVYIYIYIN